jgi:RNA polymerase sigma factor (TIGR02999 family)
MSPLPDDTDETLHSLTALFPSLYDLLRRRSAQVMRGEAPGHTLQATELVHEAFLKLASSGRYYNDVQHLLAVLTTVMRQILVDHARARLSRKRGGGLRQVPLTNACLFADQDGGTFLDVQEAIERFRAMDPVRTHMFELSFLWGMTYAEIADVLGEDVPRVKYAVQLARSWVRDAIAGAAPANGPAGEASDE